MSLPKKLQNKIISRTQENTLRHLGKPNNLVDFSSNDYLGFSKSELIFTQAHQYLVDHGFTQNGATGSRLLSGNHKLYHIAETMLCEFHNCEAALIFNSGYDANLGFFASVPQKGDIILYDEYAHASIRDGIQLSNAKAYKFKHNDLDDLKQLVTRLQERDEIYIVTESVFSMDGDSPDILALTNFCSQNNYQLIVDEAHAIGIYGKNGAGLIQELGLENKVFARLVTFGKALGGHGAAILGSESLKQYLINFARSFIYTTALAPHTLANIVTTYHQLFQSGNIKKLQHNIRYFRSEIQQTKLQKLFITSNSAVHCFLSSDAKNVKMMAQNLQINGFEVKAILSPTVPKGEERLRFCIHSFNSDQEMSEVLNLLATFVP